MIFNTKAAVVELITADTPEAAVSELHRRLTARGFTVYPAGSDAFESDDQETDE